jgi:signal transduction histidine kinase
MDPSPGWTRVHKWFVSVIVLAALSVVTTLGWSYLAVDTLRGQMEQINGPTKFVDLARQLHRLELAVTRSDRLDDPEVRNAIALLERGFQVADALTDDSDVASELARVRVHYASFELMRTTRPEAVAEAAQLIGLAERVAETAADDAASLQRDQILAQTKLVAETALRGGLAAASVILFNALLVLTLRRKFRSAYASAYELTLERAAELEQSNTELRLANESKQRFVSMVSHELRTPLTVIRGSAETLMRHGYRLSQDQRAQLSASIVRQAERQQRLVEDLLIVARQSGSAPKPNRLAFDIRDLVSRLVSELSDDLRAKVTINGDGLAVWADPRHVEQIVENLLTNAHKYGGNQICVEWRHGADGQVIVCVCDDGPGVPDSFAHTMFDEFSQADGGDTRASTGVGLGLSITRTLAFANDGLVRYRHREGGGAQFEVVLPAATREAIETQSARADRDPDRRADGPADRRSNEDSPIT